MTGLVDMPARLRSRKMKFEHANLIDGAAKLLAPCVKQ